MTTKSLLTVGALTLASIGIASAKTYDIRLDNATQVGATQLKPGEYKVKVNGSQATFTDSMSSKTYTAPVKEQNAGKKFDQTMVQTQNKNGVENLQEIDLGGSNTKLEFGE